jgi:hypothetical protein
MSSKRLTNSRVEVGVALFLMLAVTGCGKQGSSSKTAAGSRPLEPAVKAAETRAYVRLAALEARHPLQEDVQRLRNAERRLAGLAPGVLTGPGLQDPYELPAVGTQIDRPTALKVAVALNERRIRERGLLAKRTAAQLGAFLGGISYRQGRLLDQRRAELQAVGQSEQDRVARSIRDEAAEDIRNQVVQRSPEKVNRQLPVSVLSKQLRPDPEFVNDVTVPGPLINEQEVEEGIAKLAADPEAKYIPERARFIVKRRQAVRRLQELQDEIDRIVAAGNSLASDRILAARNARLAEIELELEALRDDEDTLFLFRNQRAALASALAAEADVAARTALFQGLSDQSRDGAGAVRFASLFGSSLENAGSASRALGLRRALQRVVRQRERLQRFIRADVRDAVQDAADVHNVNLTYAPGDGRRDMTAEFTGWLRSDSAGNALNSKSRIPEPGVLGG